MRNSRADDFSDGHLGAVDDPAQWPGTRKAATRAAIAERAGQAEADLTDVLDALGLTA